MNQRGFYGRTSIGDYRDNRQGPPVNNHRKPSAPGQKAVKAERYLYGGEDTDPRTTNRRTIGQVGVTPEQLAAAGVVTPDAVAAALAAPPPAVGNAGSGGGNVMYRGQKIKQVLTLDLSVARTNLIFSMGGNGVIYNDSTNGTDRIKVRFGRYDGDVSAPQITMRPGEPLFGEGFRNLSITNAVIAGATAEILIVEDTSGDRIRQA